MGSVRCSIRCHDSTYVEACSAGTETVTIGGDAMPEDKQIAGGASMSTITRRFVDGCKRLLQEKYHED